MDSVDNVEKLSTKIVDNFMKLEVVVWMGIFLRKLVVDEVGLNTSCKLSTIFVDNQVRNVYNFIFKTVETF